MGGGRFSFHFPFNLRTHKRAIEGGEPLFLGQTGQTGQGPGLALVTGERGVSGVQRAGFGQGPGVGKWRQREVTKGQSQGGAS